MAVDPVARAYATIGVPPGAPAHELKLRYKRLVRQWHPDRWTNDPAGQAEATIRMRAINDAYARLHRLQPPASKAGTRSLTRLTREEKDELVRAIGTQNPVGAAIRVLVWAMPTIAALFMLLFPKLR